MSDPDTKYAISRLNTAINELSEMLKREYIDEAWTKSMEIEINSIISELKDRHVENERIQKFLLSKLDSVGLSSKSGQVDYLKSKTQKLVDILKIGFYNSSDSEVEYTPNSFIENLFLKFHQVVKQLRKRHDNKETLDVQVEYDVQDLLHSLLRIYFDDIVPEDYTPSYAGVNSRIDFILPQEKIAIETKMIRKGLDRKKLVSELNDDIVFYQKHPNCNILYILAYDPEERIDNPRGVEAELNKKHNEMEVKLFIVPRS